jgi:phage gp29-like protein
MELCEEMEDRDGQISQALATRKQAVVACDYNVEPWRDYQRKQNKQDATTEDQEIADFVRENLLGIPYFEDRLLDLLDAVSKGQAFENILYERRDNMWWVRDLIWVPARKFTWWDSFTPRLLTEQQSREGVPLKPMHWLIHTPRGRSIEPYRAGLMRILGWYLERAKPPKRPYIQPLGACQQTKRP